MMKKDYMQETVNYILYYGYNSGKRLILQSIRTHAGTPAAIKRTGAGQLPAPGWVLSVCIYRQARP